MPKPILTQSGPGTLAATVRICSGESSASANSRSAPASRYMVSRRITSLIPWVASTSVRDMMTRSGVSRASAAARIFSAPSSAETTSLPIMWPQRLGQSWSSIMTPATPARSKARMVKCTLTALP